MRKLKFHEKKLLKRVDLYNWKKDRDQRELKIMRRYHIQNRDDYQKFISLYHTLQTRYNNLCGHVTSVISKIKTLPSSDQFRQKLIEQLLEKLYNMGILTTRENIQACEKLSVSSFCRRRLPIVLQRLKFAQTPKEAVMYIEQGHIRIGPSIVTDPAMLVTRNMEDHITWTDNSKIKAKVQSYNNEKDDYDQ